ncbi:MAG TPA: DUF3347 domain-containing protein [Ferruginibacter sp.]|nr:DUF3347 domain-containing protein [Ferruginibacter sp.]
MSKSITLTAVVFLLSSTVSKAQVNNATTATVKVYGNCSMCKTSIEKAADNKKISQADWNEATGMATITYDSKKTNLDAVLKNIALAGYDNFSFLAPDAAYNKLPGCCKYEREKKQMAIQPAKEAPGSMQNNTAHHDGMNKTTKDAIKLKVVFDSYFALKDALVKTDGKAASLRAADLQTAINTVKMDELSMEVHTVWMKVLKDIKEAASQISGKNNIAQQRDHFMSLSKNMYELIKIEKPGETVYYQFCPMANDGKGANWLSKETVIKNPYYGSQMLTCGNTVEIIKQ